MKYSLAALAATTLLGGVSARGHLHNRRHNHPAELDYNGAGTCVPQCTTIITSYLIDYTHPVHPPTQTVSPVPKETYTPTTPSEYPKATPEVTTCPTLGIYTIPAKTITLTSTEFVCVPETTKLSSGCHTIGGVTTVVEHETTIVCPAPTVIKDGDETTTTIIHTTFVCPTPGTYTIAPITTTVTEVVDCEYPVVTEYPPGVYEHPEVVTTVTVTNEVVTCPPYTKTKEVTVVPIPQSTHPALIEEPKPVESKVEKPDTYVPEEPDVEKPDTYVPEEPDVEDPPSSYVPPAPKEGLWAVTYSPYSDDGQCKSADDVDADIKDIKSKGFKSIRLYSSDCNGLQTAGESCGKYGLKIVIGVFIRAGGPSTADSQVKDIIEWNRWDLIEMFVVGNEALFQGFCTASELAIYIKKVTSEIREAGYKGPVTTTEPLGSYQDKDNYKPLCQCMDVVGINIHPYFNPQVAPEQAGEFLSSQLSIIEELCGKTGYVLEAGWPNSGEPNGKAKPGPHEQEVAVRSMEKAEPGRLCLFTYRNDLWKKPGPFRVEQNFGCGDLF